MDSGIDVYMDQYMDISISNDMHNKWMVKIDERNLGYNNEWINQWRMNVENVTDNLW